MLLSVEVRVATVDDAAVVAAVHVGSWQSAYRGLLPDAYLDALSAERRSEVWSRILTETDLPRTGTFVLQEGHDVIGFVHVAPTRDGVYRAEFRDCDLSGLQAANSRFADVAFLRCRLDGANFRTTTWERAEFADCDLVEADFYAAKLPSSRLIRCDLPGAQLSKCTLTDATLQWSVLTGLQGGESLPGVAINGDQVLSAALAIFGAMTMTVDDEPRP